MSDKLQLVGLVRSVLLKHANLTLNRQAEAYRTSPKKIESNFFLAVSCLQGRKTTAPLRKVEPQR